MIEIIAIGFGICVLLFFGVSSRGSKRFTPPQIQPITRQSAAHYSAVDSLFVNQSELTFFHALRRALPQNVLLMSKVRMEDIVKVGPHITDKNIKWHLRGRVKSRHVDYVITDRAGCPLLVIELDGSAHHNAATLISDEVKDAIFLACGLPVLRVNTSENFVRRAQIISADIARHNLAA